VSPARSNEEHPPAGIRAFVALRLSADTIGAIGAKVAELRSLGADVAWVKPANFHLTLRFLGDQVSLDKLELLKTALAGAGAETVPFVIAARGIGAFPDWRKARAVWVGLESPELITLASRVEASAVSCGFARERRRYAAHLTIGRVRGFNRWGETVRALQDWAEHDFGSSRIESITLYRSILSPAGSQYQALAEFSFGLG